MKLGQNGTVSFSIRPAVFLAGGWADTSIRGFYVNPWVKKKFDNTGRDYDI
jgi:hypothetical protein